MKQRHARRKPMYCGVTSVYPQDKSMWRLLACGPNREEVEEMARDVIGPVMPPGFIAPDIWSETQHANLRVMPRSRLIRWFGRERFYDMLDDLYRESEQSEDER